MIISEKLEECPDCGERKFWFYDGQMCANCGHGEPNSEHRNSSADVVATQKQLAETRSAMAKLLVSAKILLANAYGCAASHHLHRDGEPEWLADCRRDIEAASNAITG